MLSTLLIWCAVNQHKTDEWAASLLLHHCERHSIWLTLVLHSYSIISRGNDIEYLHLRCISISQCLIYSLSSSSSKKKPINYHLLWLEVKGKGTHVRRSKGEGNKARKSDSCVTSHSHHLMASILPFGKHFYSLVLQDHATRNSVGEKTPGKHFFNFTQVTRVCLGISISLFLSLFLARLSCGG